MSCLDGGRNDVEQEVVVGLELRLYCHLVAARCLNGEGCDVDVAEDCHFVLLGMSGQSLETHESVLASTS